MMRICFPNQQVTANGKNRVSAPTWLRICPPTCSLLFEQNLFTHHQIPPNIFPEMFLGFNQTGFGFHNGSFCNRDEQFSEFQSVEICHS